MELKKIDKEIEIRITLNGEEAETLKQIIWFACDYNCEHKSFTESEKQLSDELFNFLEKAGC